MSIVTSVKVYDGIVLGADSRTQLQSVNEHGQPTLVQTYNHARKLFPIHQLPIGILTYGVGNIGKRSVESYVIEFTRNLEHNIDLTVSEVANQLLKHFKDAFDAEYHDAQKKEGLELGVLVAGYSGTPNSQAEEWEFKIPTDNASKPVRPSDQYGASWRGISLPFTRLYNGFDPRITLELTKNGVPQEVIGKVVEISRKFTSPFVFDGMPIIDAVEFCRFILNTTVNIAKFEAGVATCGEPLDIAVITRSNGFEWVAQKKYIA